MGFVKRLVKKSTPKTRKKYEAVELEEKSDAISDSYYLFGGKYILRPTAIS